MRAPERPPPSARRSRAPRVVALEGADRPYAIAAALATSGFRLTASIARAQAAVVDSLETLRALRAQAVSIPVLAVSADVVTALTAGADECVTPPYSAAELGARIRALLVRVYGRMHWRPIPIQIGRLRICPVTREATCDGAPVSLSPKEHALLLALLENYGRVMTRGELLARVWPERTVPNARTLDMHIAWLRQKIEPDRALPRIIRTVPSVGYLMAVAPVVARRCAS